MDLTEIPSFPLSKLVLQSPEKFYTSSSLSNAITNPSYPPQSPVPHFLNPNPPPSKSEITMIQDAVLNVETRIITILQVDGHQPSGPNEFVRSHKSVLSPVRCLPNEIVQEIFSHFIPSYQYSRGGPRYSDIPWILGHICRRWRTIAMSLPCLWNRIPTINMTREFESTSPSYLEFLTRLVKLSGSAPNLGVYFYSYGTEILKHPVIDLLIQNSERMEHLIIWSHFCTISAFRSIKGRIPHLRVLSLAPLTPDAMLARNIDTFEMAPALQEVRLLRGMTSQYLKLPRLPLVFYKEDESIEGGVLCQVFSSTNSLISLSISCFLTLPHIPPIIFSRLVSLGLDLSIHTGHLIDNITVPAIKNLRILYPGELFPRVASLLSRSGLPSALQTLTIFGPMPLPGELKSLLQLTPQLIYLHTRFASIDDFTMFIISTESPRLLPLLDTLSIYCDLRNWDGLERAINAIARSRCELIDRRRLEEEEDRNLCISSAQDTRRLKRLNISSPFGIIQLQNLLNHWTIVPDPAINDEIQVLTQLCRALDVNLNLATEKLGEQMDQALCSLENYEVQRIESLIISKVHVDLWNMIHYLAPAMTNDRYCFRERAHKILKKWEPRLMEWLPTCRWALMSHRSTLVYIPSDDPLRTSQDAMNILYGLNLDYCKLPDNLPWSTDDDYPESYVAQTSPSPLPVLLPE